MRFIRDIIRQLFGWDTARPGKLSISYWASIQMREHRLDFDTLEDVFRHGRKVTTIVQDYQNYSISIGYRWDERKACYVITSVRLYKREGVKK
jgi:expansin (peptidoglycan-binding protein)